MPRPGRACGSGGIWSILPSCLDLPDMCLTGHAPYLIVGTIVLLYRHRDVLWLLSTSIGIAGSAKRQSALFSMFSNYIVTRLTDTKRSQKFSREVTFAFMPEA